MIQLRPYLFDILDDLVSDRKIPLSDRAKWIVEPPYTQLRLLFNYMDAHDGDVDLGEAFSKVVKARTRRLLKER
jgi:hypothetical protein